ncbi:MAG: HYR domain-containing protein, partial [Verrucomicrobiota bacterium]
NEEGAFVFFNVSAGGGCGPLNFYTFPSTGDFFRVGTTTVYVSASDDCGDTTNCSFTVTVVLPPITLNCSSNIIVTANAPGGASVFFTVTGSGGCQGAPNVESEPPSGSFFPLGTTVVTSTADNYCDNSTNCTFTVTVNPPSPIMLNCSSNITATRTDPNGATIFYAVTASGGCSNPTVTAYPPSGSTFPPGPTTVYVTASDDCGDYTNCSFVVTVISPPIVLNCSSNITATANNPGGATVFYTVTASGGCTAPAIAAYPPSGSLFPSGSTTVYVTANDGCGTSASCSFVVTVVRLPIALNCSSNITVTATSSSGAAVYYGVAASGGCSPPVISSYPPP